MALGRVARVAAVAVIVSASGCDRYVSSSRVSRAASTRTTEHVVGAGVVIPNTPRTAPSPSTTTNTLPLAVHRPVPVTRAATAPRDICAGPNRPEPVNVEHRDLLGLRLTLTVGDKLCFARGETASLELDVENVSNTGVEYDTSQLSHFLVRPVAGGRSWRDHSCGELDDPNREGRIETGPFALDPGDKVQFVVEYPGDRRARARCGGQVGEQQVYGYIFVCTANTPEHDDCAPNHRTVAFSPPVRIRIG